MAIKASPKPEKDRSERWLLTYADLITLLMVFFVILYSFATIDVKKFLNLKGSLDKAFNTGVLAGIASQGFNQQLSGASVQEQIAAANESAKASVASQLQKIAEATGSGEAIQITATAEGVTVSLSANVLFQSGTAELKPGAVDLLKAVAQPLKDIPNPLEVAANTDDLPPAPTNSKFKDNWEMGHARAYTVMRALVDQASLPENRLSLRNNGQYKPLYPNDSPENRAKNRRVDLVIVFPRPEDQPIGQPFAIPGPAPLGAAPGPGASSR
ncbi:MAG: flagellar motor protein MotB [Chloroflexota bacterium]|nr:flagellar motor protein MotB [Chloroflexota bacterium]